MGKKVLIIVHQERSSPGRVGLKLRARGYELDIRRPPLGDVLPESLEDYAGTVIFGGPMSANDDDTIEGIRREIEWIGLPLKEKSPLLGLCLGAQMMARHLGAEVKYHPEKQAEIGYYPLVPTPAGKALFGDWPKCVYQWHREGFDLPAGARLLAKGGNAFPNQAFDYEGTAIGLQFHPEVTLAMTHRWTVLAAKRFSLPGVRPRPTHFRDRLVHDGAVDAWLDRLLDGWLKSGQKIASAPQKAVRKIA
jgi:GMP synthase (glutamine-hydrolysing)